MMKRAKLTPSGARRIGRPELTDHIVEYDDIHEIALCVNNLYYNNTWLCRYASFTGDDPTIHLIDEKDKYPTLYKVCLWYHGGWHSSEHRHDLLSLRYELNRRTVPKIKGSCIYTFSSIERAYSFYAVCYSRQHGAIFRGIGERSDTAPFRVGHTYLGYESATVDYWTNGSGRGYEIVSAPVGTVMCHWFVPHDVVRYTKHEK